MLRLQEGGPNTKNYLPKGFQFTTAKVFVVQLSLIKP